VFRLRDGGLKKMKDLDTKVLSDKAARLVNESDQWLRVCEDGDNFVVIEDGYETVFDTIDELNYYLEDMADTFFRNGR
jgi:hypothetical protein